VDRKRIWMHGKNGNEKKIMFNVWRERKDFKWTWK
jgi:hypothetical protein